MPKGVPLSEKEKQQIYTRYVINGDRQREIAEDFKISSNTVSKVIAEMRKAGESKVHEKVIAGNKRNGRLTAGKTPNLFEGTCIVGGKSHSKKFSAPNGHIATEQWEKWCQDLRDEAEFMAMVERKPKEEGFVPTDEPVAFEDFLEDEPKAVCGHPGDPIEEIQPIEPAPVPEIDVRPWRNIAEELQSKVTEMQQAVDFCKRLEEAVNAGEPVDLWGTTYHPAIEVEQLKDELEVSKTQRIEFAEGYQIEMHNPAYLLWVKGAEPRAYGLYLDENRALTDGERLTEVARFLGSDGVFDVEEVQWR